MPAIPSFLRAIHQLSSPQKPALWQSTQLSFRLTISRLKNRTLGQSLACLNPSAGDRAHRARARHNFPSALQFYGAYLQKRIGMSEYFLASKDKTTGWEHCWVRANDLNSFGMRPI